jgi:hypothetical protein
LIIESKRAENQLFDDTGFTIAVAVSEIIAI